MTSVSDAKTWLVTGASQGLGLAISLAVLEAGHNVVACARNPEKAGKEHPELAKKGGKWLKLDVTSPDTEKIVREAIEKEGRVDVVVNVAGYTMVGSVEDLSIEEVHGMMDTKFYGALRVLKGALPSMRARKSGTLVTMSSVFGFVAYPGAMAYNCANFALDGLGETLAAELAPFNIRSVILQPGLFRTNVMASAHRPEAGISEAYDESIGAGVKFVQYSAAHPEETQPGDPSKLGKRVVEFVDGTGMAKGMEKYLRLSLGSDGYQQTMGKMASLKENYEAVGAIAGSTDFEGTTGKGVNFKEDTNLR